MMQAKLLVAPGSHPPSRAAHPSHRASHRSSHRASHRAGLLAALGAVGLALAAAACTAAHADDERATKARAGFATLYKVLQHPRCVNCHPAGDAPLQQDDSRPHGMNITRRSEANGTPCASCHGTKNGNRPGMPPGAPNWKLPPTDTPMIFQGKSPRQLCEQLKDPRHNGNRDVAKLIEHIARDELVAWGWAPGPGRAPVPIPRADVVAAMQTWADAGAPCPE